MKKTILLFIFISLFYIFISNVMAKTIEIPDDAIRIRIIPNSNKYHDQEIKNKVKDKLQTNLYQLLKNDKNSEEAKITIKNNLEKIDESIKIILKEEKYTKNYKLNFGYNYFPKKKYNGIKYNAGYYESLLITLGEGKGDNWWCVLFPPLCLIEAENTKNVEYKSFIKEIINKYL